MILEVFRHANQFITTFPVPENISDREIIMNILGLRKIIYITI